MTRSFVVSQSGSVDVGVLEEILRILIFFGDSVMIRASYEIPSRSTEEQRRIENMISDLREVGLVQTWAHEYEVNDGGWTVSRLNRTVSSPNAADKILGYRDVQSTLSEIDDLVFASRDLAYARDGERVKLRQGAAELVGFREQLVSLVLASNLDQDGIIGSPRGKTLLGKGLDTNPIGSFRDHVARQVIELIGVGSLSALSVEQVVEARRYSRDFRSLVDEIVIDASSGAQSQITPESVTQKIVDMYEATLLAAQSKELDLGLVREAGWDISGLILPPVLALKYVGKYFKWRSDKERRPFLLLSSLRSHGS